VHTTRFAPSPTGLLHLGHAFAALSAAQAAGPGRFLLRIEDLDATRARPEFAQAIEEDLAWLGLSWPTPVLRQSSRLQQYRSAIDGLAAQELLYPCFCTRKQIAAEVARALEAPHQSDGLVYPGTCRSLTSQERTERLARGEPYVLRLSTAAASSRVGALSFIETGAGPGGETGLIHVDPCALGDVVLGRRDAPAAYHLAVVLDDAFQGVTLVTRGNDLFAATHVQRLLQALLGLPAPRYAHHRLILDADGSKLSKREGATTLRDLRGQGWQAREVRRQLPIATS
jgi:glutamyl-Q tRNA(Asp) synthetase